VFINLNTFVKLVLPEMVTTVSRLVTIISRSPHNDTETFSQAKVYKSL